MTLMDRIERGGVVLMDGAMGTELERRGVPMHGQAWSAAAMDSHPEVVRDIHRDYIAAGAELHIVNSFALGRHVLERAGLGDRFEAVNRRSVELCKEAIDSAAVDRPQWITGSLSTFADKSNRGLLPQGPNLRASYAEQAEILREAGADLFALEMLCDVEISIAALHAAAATKLPVILGFTCSWDDDGTTVLAGAHDMGVKALPLAEVLLPVLAAIPDGTAAMVAVMHSEFDVSDAALAVIQDHWSGPTSVYPNSGGFIFPNWQFDTVCTPDEFADAGVRWIAAGAQVVGGCCGVGPPHIEALAARLAKSQSA